MDAFFDKVAQRLGGAITGDHLKLVISILSSYVFAWTYRYLPASPTTRHLYSVTIALMTTLAFLKMYAGFLHITITSLATFLWMKYNHNAKAPWINFIMVMVSMSLCHLDRQWKGNAGDTTLDYSGMMMVATIKLTMFGFNVQDGRATSKNKTQLTSYNQQMKIDRFPSVLEFSGWMLFFGGYLVGPACEYMDYLRFVHQSDMQKSPSPAIPSSAKPTLIILAKSALFITILISCSNKYNLSIMLTPEWQALPFVKKLLFVQMTAFVARCKYYTAWLLSEGACVLCGFGFNGYNERGQARWDRLTNIDILHCEFPQSIKEMGDYWNMGANRWLKHYVYLRVTPPNKKAGLTSALVTYCVSALWHGFYPGYYIMFLSLALFQNVGRMLRKTLRPFTFHMVQGQPRPMPFVKAGYDHLGVIITTFTINTMSMSFVGLYWSTVMSVWRQIYYIHYILGILAWLALKIAYQPLITAQRRRASKWTFVPSAAEAKPMTPPPSPKAKDMDVTDLGGVEPPMQDFEMKKQQ